MKPNLLRLLSLPAGVLIFDFLFWQHGPGLNALILVPVLIMIVRIAGRNPFRNRTSVIAVSGLLLAGFSVFLYSSAVSVLTYFGTLGLFLGLSLEPDLRSPVSAILQAGFNFIFGPLRLFSELGETIQLKQNARSILRLLRILILPLAILAIFITIYRFANPVFNRIFAVLDDWFSQLSDWLAQFLSIGHLVFVIFAVFIFTGIIYKGRHRIGPFLERGRSDLLLRKRKKIVWLQLFPSKIMGLKDEYRIGLFIMALLITLLLVVNITEILWLNGEYGKSSAPEMSQHLHEGTGLLIFSILLSILVLLTLFRRNLNFYPGNRWLVRGAEAWIILNMVMGINVALRNWYYISQYGLTHLRIGIYFFLLLVMAGLVLMFIKISRRKSTWYLIRMSAWVFYFTTILLAIADWDSMIIRYNLREKAPIVDTGYLLSLPDRNTGSLDNSRQKMIDLSPGMKDEINQRLNWKINSFVEKYRKTGFQSLNYRAWKSMKYLRARETKTDPRNSS
jgi:hypothetical protein